MATDRDSRDLNDAPRVRMMSVGRHFKSDDASAAVRTDSVSAEARAAAASPSETSQFIAAAASRPAASRADRAPRTDAPASRASSPQNTGILPVAAERASAPVSAATGAAAAPARAPRPVRPATRRAPAGSADGVIPPHTPAQQRAYDSAARDPRRRGNRAPRRRSRRLLPIALIAVGIVLLLTSAGLFIHAQLGYREAKQAYDELTQYAVADDSSDGVPTVDFDALAQINPDVVGWIYVPGTVINYPVVQTGNNSTYLTRMFNGVNNGNGAIFMDMDDTAPGVQDQQTTLYGHHMNDASMFNFIDKTRDQATFDTVQKVYYITRDATYEFKPLCTTQVQDDYGDARVANFENEAALTSYLQSMLKEATAKAPDTDGRANNPDKVLTLVTCADGIIQSSTRATMVCTLEQTTGK